MTIRADDFTPQPFATGRGRIVRPLGRDEEEDNMPTGVYPRKPRSESPDASQPAPTIEAPTRKRRKPRRAAKITKLKRGKPGRRVKPAPRLTTARFGVFEDGSVQINTEACKGNLEPAEVDSLYEFIKRLQKAA